MRAWEKELVESCGHVLRMGVKGHPEMAGKGIEYCWGKSKQKFRRDVNDRVQAHDCHDLSILITTYASENHSCEKILIFFFLKRLSRGHR